MRRSRHLDALDRLFGTLDDDAPPPARVWLPSLAQWWCPTDDIIIGQADHLLPPRCDLCDAVMERYLIRSDPTRADRPNW